ncbi:MAG: U32 family peptidase, partial [Ignavibacteriae bacterium]
MSITRQKQQVFKPELMAPAGDWTMLRTAVQAGADAVYFGVDKLNMRAKAANFKVDDLPEIEKFCTEND